MKNAEDYIGNVFRIYKDYDRLTPGSDEIFVLITSVNDENIFNECSIGCINHFNCYETKYALESTKTKEDKAKVIGDIQLIEEIK